MHNKHIHSWSKGLGNGGCDWCRTQEGRIEGRVAFRMQSARDEKLGSRVAKKSNRKKMQGYPHFSLFFSFFLIPSGRSANEVRREGRAKEGEKDDEG